MKFSVPVNDINWCFKFEKKVQLSLVLELDNHRACLS